MDPKTAGRSNAYRGDVVNLITDIEQLGGPGSPRCHRRAKRHIVMGENVRINTRHRPGIDHPRHRDLKSRNRDQRQAGRRQQRLNEYRGRRVRGAADG